LALTDLIVLIVSLFVIAFFILIATILKDNLLVGIEGMMTETSSIEVLADVKGAIGIFDYAFLIIAVGGGISMIVLASQLDAHPSYFFLSLIITLVSLLLSPIFANMFDDIASSGIFVSVAEGYPIMRMIFQNYATYILAIGILMSAILYARSRGGRE